VSFRGGGKETKKQKTRVRRAGGELVGARGIRRKKSGGTEAVKKRLSKLGGGGRRTNDQNNRGTPDGEEIHPLNKKKRMGRTSKNSH